MKTAILVLVGPTASGKSALALRLSRNMNGEIVSADSRQVYSSLTIGTAQPSMDQRGGIPHHLLDCIPLTTNYTAGAYAHDADVCIRDIVTRGKTPVVVGGSGLYIQALIDGFHKAPAANEIREHLTARLHDEGGAALLEELRGIDPEIARTMTPRTTHRIVRALEVYALTGIPLSKHHEMQPHSSPYRAFQAGLLWDRAQLYDRINVRVEKMLANGLLDEVRGLLSRGFDGKMRALQTVGYQEVFPYLRGEYSEQEMVRLIKRNSRRYAKRQMTWFRRDKRIHWYPIGDEKEFDGIARQITDEYKKFVETEEGRQ